MNELYNILPKDLALIVLDYAKPHERSMFHYSICLFGKCISSRYVEEYCYAHFIPIVKVRRKHRQVMKQLIKNVKSSSKWCQNTFLNIYYHYEHIWKKTIFYDFSWFFHLRAYQYISLEITKYHLIYTFHHHYLSF